jgi:hypothetical protein
VPGLQVWPLQLASGEFCHDNLLRFLEKALCFYGFKKLPFFFFFVGSFLETPEPS